MKPDPKTWLSEPRRQHLDWVREREPVATFNGDDGGPFMFDVRRLVKDGDLEEVKVTTGLLRGFPHFQLTRQGRRKLELAEADIGGAVVDHLRMTYPAALEAVPTIAAASLRNFVNARVASAMRRHQEGKAS